MAFNTLGHWFGIGSSQEFVKPGKETGELACANVAPNKEPYTTAVERAAGDAAWMEATGCKWRRLSWTWSVIEPNGKVTVDKFGVPTGATQYAESQIAFICSIVDIYHDHGIAIMPNIMNSPNWSRSSPYKDSDPVQGSLFSNSFAWADNPDDYGDAVRHCLRVLYPRAQAHSDPWIRAVSCRIAECSNEPNQPGFAQSPNDPAVYADMVWAAHKKVHAAVKDVNGADIPAGALKIGTAGFGNTRTSRHLKQDGTVSWKAPWGVAHYLFGDGTVIDGFAQQGLPSVGFFKRLQTLGDNGGDAAPGKGFKAFDFLTIHNYENAGYKSAYWDDTRKTGSFSSIWVSMSRVVTDILDGIASPGDAALVVPASMKNLRINQTEFGTPFPLSAQATYHPIYRNGSQLLAATDVLRSTEQWVNNKHAGVSIRYSTYDRASCAADTTQLGSSVHLGFMTTQRDEKIRSSSWTNPLVPGRTLAANFDLSTMDTTLRAPVTATQTTLPYATADVGIMLHTGPIIVQVDGEKMKVTGGFATDTWTVQRGYAGTTPAAHANGAAVSTIGLPSGSGVGPVLHSELLRLKNAQAGPDVVNALFGAVVADTTAPSVPTWVSLSGDTASGTTLTWNASTDDTGVDHYTITRTAPTAATFTVTPSGGPTESLNIPGDNVNGSTYTYKIKASDAAGNTSVDSTTRSVTITVADTAPPSVPANFTSTATTTSVVLTWSASTDTGGSGLAGYNVYREPAFSTPVTVTAPTVTYTDTDVTSGRGAHYWVTAIDNAGNESAPSGLVIVSVPYPAVVAVGDLTAQVAGFTKPVAAGTQKVATTRQPKLILPFSVASTAGGTFRAGHLLTVGFSDGAGSEASVAASAQNGANPSAGARRMASKAFSSVKWDNSGPISEAAATAVGGASPGVSYNWTTASSSADLIAQLTLHGSDIVDVAVGEFTVPATVGTYDLDLGIDNVDVALFQAAGNVGNAVPWMTANSAFAFGACDTAGNQWTGGFLDANGQTPTQAAGLFLVDSCLAASPSAGGGAPQFKLSFNSVIPGGVRLNVLIASGPGAKVKVALVAGGRWKVGNFNKSTGLAPAAQSIAVGIPWTVAMLCSKQAVSSATATDHARFGFGVSDGTTVRSIAVASLDNNPTSDVDAVLKTGKAFMVVDNNSGTVDAECDLTGVGTNNLAFSWTTNHAVATQIGYVVGAPNAAGSVPAYSPRVQVAGQNAQGAVW